MYACVREGERGREGKKRGKEIERASVSEVCVREGEGGGERKGLFVLTGIFENE